MVMHRLAAGALLAGFVCVASAAGAAQAAAPSSTAPLKVLLLPSDIKIFTIGLGSDEEATDDSVRMTAATDAELRRILAASPTFKLLDMPALSDAEQATLKQHVALYKIEAGDAYSCKVRGGVWKQVIDNFDYSIGPGLAFLEQRSGAEYGLVVFGIDGESTGANILLGNRRGRNHLYAGLLDLATGNVVWLHHDDHNSANFTSKNNMESFVDELIQNYPDGSVHASSVTQ